jgi:TPR repeat protein
VTQIYTEALRLYRLAAAQGEMHGQTNLGFMYATGKGVAENHVMTLNWYVKAAQQGFARAQYNAAVVLYNGIGGVPQDYQQALVWNELAVQGGQADAIKYQQAYLNACTSTCRTNANALIQKFQVQDPCEASRFTSAKFCNGRGTPTPEDDSVQRVCVHRLPEWLRGQVL